MERPWIGTGWKMNKLLADTDAYLDVLLGFLENAQPETLPTIFLVPPFTVLRDACRRVRGAPVLIGAQNMHWEAGGAFTGEVSPAMIRDCGAHLVELGHSERRAMFNETDAAVNRKVHAALAHGLRPLVCVGETAAQKDYGVSREVVAAQVKIALHGVPPDAVDQLIIAYEPVWAIGEGGVSAAPEYADAIHRVIRQAVADMSDPAAASRIPLLYGGSVNLDNVRALLAQPAIDGVFVGRTAWKVEGLLELIRMAGEFIIRKQTG